MFKLSLKALSQTYLTKDAGLFLWSKSIYLRLFVYSFLPFSILKLILEKLWKTYFFFYIFSSFVKKKLIRNDSFIDDLLPTDFPLSYCLSKAKLLGTTKFVDNDNTNKASIQTSSINQYTFRNTQLFLEKKCQRQTSNMFRFIVWKKS